MRKIIITVTTVVGPHYNAELTTPSGPKVVVLLYGYVVAVGVLLILECETGNFNHGQNHTEDEENIAIC